MKLSKLKKIITKPLDPSMINGKLVHPCVRTHVYSCVLNNAVGGVTALDCANILETTLDVVTPHLTELHSSGHIFLKKGKGAFVRKQGHLQIFAKYVLYN